MCKKLKNSAEFANLENYEEALVSTNVFGKFSHICQKNVGICINFAPLLVTNECFQTIILVNFVHRKSAIFNVWHCHIIKYKRCS